MQQQPFSSFPTKQTPRVQDVIQKYSLRKQASSQVDVKLRLDDQLINEKIENLPKGFDNPIPFTDPSQILEHSKSLQGPRITFGFSSTNCIFQYSEDQLFNEMNAIKEKILNLLQQYSSMMGKNSNLKEIKQMIKQDAKQISSEYQQIISKINDLSSLNQKQQELNKMFELVEDFLSKFNVNNSNLLRQKKMMKYDQQKLEMSYQNSFSEAQHEDTFYRNTNIHGERLIRKLTNLKTQLAEELSKCNLVHTKNILNDMIKSLTDILMANDTQTIKNIVYQIEKNIKNLNMEDQGSIKLYNCMAKAIKETNKIFQPDLCSSTQSEDSGKTMKRRFYDQAITIKSKLPENHPKRGLLVSQLFDEYISGGYRDANDFLRIKFTQ